MIRFLRFPRDSVMKRRVLSVERSGEYGVAYHDNIASCVIGRRSKRNNPLWLGGHGCNLDVVAEMVQPFE
jgi:hypothetical protein